MNRGKSLIVAAFVLALAPGAGPASAQCLLCDVEEEEEDEGDLPLRIEVGAELNFDRVALTSPAGGAVMVDPLGRTRTVTGSLANLGGLWTVGTATLRGDPGRAVRVTMPTSIALRSPSGAVATVGRLLTDLPIEPRLGRDGTLRFSFGGRLDVTGGAEGGYTGRVPITADYR